MGKKLIIKGADFSDCAVVPYPGYKPDVHFPLTENGNDIILGLQPTYNINTLFSENGMYVNGSDSVNGGLGFEFDENSVLKEISTLYAEFKADDVNDSYQQYIMGLCALPAKHWTLSIGVIASAGSLQATVNPVGVDGSINVPYSKSTWHKIATNRVNNTFKVFMDGQLVYQLALSGDTSSPNLLCIGNSWRIVGETVFRVFKGYIKNVKGFKRHTTDEELIELTKSDL